ncbi:MAG TPA: pyruvate carboxyltransferase, partial [Opitutus sp.]|nr:pyruvate carboxyltransferase [Opitutus sp.]
LGWIPLVTPTSQIVGTQAMLNVKFGRWKNLSQPAIDVALGKYGRTPGPIDPVVLNLARGKAGTEPIAGRPADALPPRMPKLREELAAAGLPTDDEACVLYAMFPREFTALQKNSAGAAPAPAPGASTPTASGAAAAPVAKGATSRYALTIDGRRTEVTVTEIA